MTRPVNASGRCHRSSPSRQVTSTQRPLIPGGTVVAASPVAAADARAAGYPALVGMQLMRRYVPAGPARWQGTVFVPDIGRSFSSHIDLVDADHARVSGCLFGQFLCRSQLWRRA